eukprot:scaffold1690_cov182-Amphora_coffeaeformis.AAC.49
MQIWNTPPVSRYPSRTRFHVLKCTAVNAKAHRDIEFAFPSAGNVVKDIIGIYRTLPYLASPLHQLYIDPASAVH